MEAESRVHMQGKKLYAHFKSDHCDWFKLYIFGSVFISFFYSHFITFSKQLQLQLHSADMLEIKKENKKKKNKKRKEIQHCSICIQPVFHLL